MGASRWFDSRDASASCGTVSGYQRHCRLGEDACTSCKAASRSYRRRLRGGFKQPDALQVECWCRSKIMNVPTAEVRACRTRSCGKPSCHAEVPA